MTSLEVTSLNIPDGKSQLDYMQLALLLFTTLVVTWDWRFILQRITTGSFCSVPPCAFRNFHVYSIL